MKELGKVLDKALVEAVDSSMHGKPSLRDVAISVGKDVCTWPAAFLHLTSSLNLRDGPQLAKLEVQLGIMISLITRNSYAANVMWALDNLVPLAEPPNEPPHTTGCRRASCKKTLARSSPSLHTHIEHRQGP